MLKDYLFSKNINSCFEEKLLDFAHLTLEWNEKINLTAVRNFDEFINKNIIDSISLYGFSVISDARNILDLGTGGGFPGVPLAIVYPEKNFILADSIAKKLMVIDDVCTRLNISNVKTVHGRAEDLAKLTVYREKFDLVVSRAVSNMSVLSEYCLPFVRTGGFFVAYKTSSSIEEINNSANAVSVLGGSVVSVFNSDIDGSGHIFASVKKLHSTPKLYPRKAGIPLKNPL